MTEKAPDAFRTISEVAEDLALPQHVLRFWETRFAQIRPLKRGGGRRYYRPEDIDLLRGIRHLLYEEGYTIKGVQRILKERGVRQVAAAWKAAQTPQSPAAGPTAPAIPAPPESAGHETVAPAAGEASGRQPAPRRSEADRRALEALLTELRACRDLLSAAREES